jgi:hypothetical protein
VIAILEDDPARAAAMKSALRRRLPDAEALFFDNAPDMVAWLPGNLPTVCLLSLDHDLGPNRQRDGKVFDPGDGRDVVTLLEGIAPSCRVLIHSSNGPAAEGMFYALQRSGWSAQRVYPFKDLAWVGTDWVKRVLLCVADADAYRTLSTLSPHPPEACTCFNQTGSEHEHGTPVLHGEQQNTNSAVWRRVCDRIERAIDTGVEDFAPLQGLSSPERAKVITLPASIGRLVRVRKLNLFSSHLVRIPPEIGEMHSLADLDLYTSYRLHFLPFEILYCSNLRKSCFSTRALYGNYKYRPPFPDLTHSDNAPALAEVTPTICSVCDVPLDRAAVIRRWITLGWGTDYLPLLVNACSEACIESLPPPPAGYVQYPHVGGAQLVQPPAE